MREANAGRTRRCATAAAVLSVLIFCVAGAATPATVAQRPHGVSTPAESSAPDGPAESPSPTPTETEEGSTQPDEFSDARPHPRRVGDAYSLTDPRHRRPHPRRPSAVAPVPAVPPAITTSTIALPTLLIAVGVLLAAGLFVWWLMRSRPPGQPAAAQRRPARGGPRPGGAGFDGGAGDGDDRQRISGRLSCATRSKTWRRRAAGRQSRRSSSPHRSSCRPPTAPGRRPARCRPATRSYLLHQVDMVDRIVGVARTRPGAADVGEATDRWRAGLPAAVLRPQRIGAYGVLSAALSVLLGASGWGVLLAGAAGTGGGNGAAPHGAAAVEFPSARRRRVSLASR